MQTGLWPGPAPKLTSQQQTEPVGPISGLYTELWKPNPGPQTLALLSPADELGYGGQAGGGKSDLLIGLAVLQHRLSHIFRRVGTSLDALEKRSKEILQQGVHGSYNSTDKVWRLNDGREIKFAHCEHEKDREKWQGKAGDFKGFDELTQFTESLYLYLSGWNRSTVPGQRSRRVATFNPPQTVEGEWVIDRFGAWLDPDHPNPAKPGELRHFARVESVDTMFDGPGTFTVGGKTYTTQSRTFIPAALSDNPQLAATDYESMLDQMPEPLRTQLKEGNFGLTKTDDPWGVLPASWVEQAQARWTSSPPKNMPDAVGIDPSRGGDRFSKVRRHGSWYSMPESWQGADVDTGPKGALKASEGIPKNVPMFVDLIGYGSSTFDSLVSMGHAAVGVNVAEGSDARDKTGFLTFKDKKTELWWKFRESLDPETGTGVALPPSKTLKRELCAHKFTVMAGGVLTMLPKDKVKEIIGCSPDEADAVILASMSGPPSAKGMVY